MIHFVPVLIGKCCMPTAATLMSTKTESVSKMSLLFIDCCDISEREKC